MIKNEEEENVVTDFSHIEDEHLRNYNRGAILANIFEDYYKDVLADSATYKDLLLAMDEYLIGVSSDEQVSAFSYMKEHLLKRGVTFGC